MPARLPSAPIARWTIASAWMRGVIDLMEAEGLDVAALLREARLDSRLLERPDGRFAVEQVDQLWDLAAKRANKPYIALSRAKTDRPTSFDVLAYAMMSCRDLDEAIARLVHYRAVVSDAVELRLGQVPGGLRLEVLPMEPLQPGRTQRLDYSIVTFLSFCRWVTCRNVMPLGVELSYSAPPDCSLHHAVLGANVIFGAPEHALLLRNEDLRLPLPTANEALSQLHDRVVRQHLQQLNPSRIQGRVAASLIRRIGHGRVNREDVAADLCMSDRTLQRRLTEAGTSFQREIDDLRRQLAKTYLSDPGLPLASIGSLLGFAEESTFYRACRRWFQKSPAQVRDSR